MSRDAIPPGGPETATWRQWLRILAWVLAEPFRYAVTGDEQAAVARYRAACGQVRGGTGPPHETSHNRMTEREDG